jgi:hypothetical protein
MLACRWFVVVGILMCYHHTENGRRVERHKTGFCHAVTKRTGCLGVDPGICSGTHYGVEWADVAMQADHPQATPAEVKAAIIAGSTKDKILSSVLKPGTPNRLLYSVMGGNELILAQAVSSFFGPPDGNGG